MGLCVKCIYHSNEGKNVMKKIRGTNTMIHITHFCKHPDYVKIDYVTGEVHYESCYALNGFEECPNWDDGQLRPNPDTPSEDTPTDDTPTEDTPIEDTTTGGEKIDITTDGNEMNTENEEQMTDP